MGMIGGLGEAYADMSSSQHECACTSLLCAPCVKSFCFTCCCSVCMLNCVAAAYACSSTLQVTTFMAVDFPSNLTGD